MLFCRTITSIALLALLPLAAFAQSDTKPDAGIHIELNTINDTGTACRISFVATNTTDADIEQAVFETVIFDSAGSVMTLSLFDFRDLPPGRPRVRQFDVPGMTCDALGQALINGANTCTVSGAESDLCNASLSLSSRIDVELLG